jgi:hypothetical protein
VSIVTDTAPFCMLPQPDMAFAHHRGIGPVGFQMAIAAPSRSPQKRRVCREKAAGVRDPRPLGAVMRSSAIAFEQTREVLPQRGHGLRGLVSRVHSDRASGARGADG